MHAVEPAEPRVDGIRVAVRVRPLNQRELSSAADSPLDWRVGNSDVAQTISSRPVPANTFTFDHVFNEKANNEQVFDNLARPVVGAALEGYNATIFAYGQTSSGKTHSMLGTRDDPGVTRRAIQEVFEQVRRMSDRQFLLRASYIEIYQEIIRDLLEPSHDNLKIHEDLNRRVYVDAREHVVASVDEVMNIISEGESVRAVGGTQMNERSSRSHTIFTLLIESRAKKEVDPAASHRNGVEHVDEDIVDEGIAVRASTLSLVDLAGSERANLTGAEGVRLKEGSHINKSLLTLGNVINKLSSAEPGANTAHVPYRDSKLTRILQPALGGNARTAILCAVTPAIMHMEETLSTLKFASRAKKVKNRTQCNEFLDDTAKLRRSEKEIARLKKVVAALQSSDGDAQPDVLMNESPKLSTRRRESAASNRVRVETFAKKFEKMCAALPFDRTESVIGEPAPVLTSSLDLPSTANWSLRAALDLANLGPRRANVTRTETDSPSTDAELAACRKQLFAAEHKQERMHRDISFERKAMQAEVEALVEAAEDANRMRESAESACQSVKSSLAEATAVSLLDEIVAGAVTTAEVAGELQHAQLRLLQLEVVEDHARSKDKEITRLKTDLGQALRREKGGMGPVLKEANTLRAKLNETDSKLKSARQATNKISSEKTLLEKDVMAKERQIKALDTELQKYRKLGARAKAREDQELNVERKKFCEELSVIVETRDTALRQVAELEALESTLRTDLSGRQSEIIGMEDKLKHFERQLASKGAELAHKDDVITQLTSDADSMGEQLAKSELALEELRAETVTLTKYQTDATRLAEELGAQLASAKKASTGAESCAAAMRDKAKACEDELNALRAFTANAAEEHETSLAESEKKRMESEQAWATMQSELESVQAARMASEDCVLELKASLTSRESELSQMHEMYAKAQAQAEQKTLFLNEESKRVDSLKTELANAVESLAALQQRKAFHKDDADLSAETLGANRCRIEELEKLLASESSKYKEKEAQVSAYESELAAAREKQSVISAELERHTELSASLREKAASVEKRNADLALCEASLRKLLASQESALQAAGQSGESHRQKLIEMRSQLQDALAAAARCAQCAVLSAQVSDLQQVQKAASRELKEHKDNVKDARIALGSENGRLAEVVQLERAGRVKEAEKAAMLLEKVYQRDARIGDLEAKLLEYRRSGGAIGKLERKLERRQTVVDELHALLSTQGELIAKRGLSVQWMQAEQVVRVKAENEALRIRMEERDREIAALHENEAKGQEERRKLREEIKARELAREKGKVEKLRNGIISREQGSLS